MKRSTDAERGRQWRLTRDEIEAIMRRAFGPEARFSDVQELSGGTVNSTYLLVVADAPPCVLRVAPSALVVAGGPSWLTATSLRCEHALTPWMAPVADLLPRTLAADFTHQLIDRDWVVQTVVPGTAWSDLEPRLTAEERTDLWRQLGGITADLHAVVGDRFGSPERPCRRWSEVIDDDLAGLLRDWQRFDLPLHAELLALAAAVQRNRATLDHMTTPHPIHSDLHQRHLFVDWDADGRVRITGLIDHEYGRFADPVSEGLITSLLYTPPQGAEAFWERYPRVPSDDATRWRSYLYRAIALGWDATDNAHRGDEWGLDHALTELSSGVIDAVIDQ
ncbi:MAG: aminoglycoside phosphotransferase family protein [Chloroflexota bacterium]|nr:aminoglycoside phosphotransferase family protein [Chloroflexota bacterium]